jgi:hypothetical protein
MTPSLPTGGEGGQWAARFRTIEAAAVAGLVHSVLMVVALRMLLGLPDIYSSNEEIADFYGQSERVRGALPVIVATLAVIALLWFVGVIRHRIGGLEPPFFSTVFFGGSILYAALMLVGVVALAAPAVLVEVAGRVPDPDVAAVTRSFGVTMLSGVVSRVQALVVLSTAALGRATRSLPVWLVLLSYLLGLGLLITVTFFSPGLYAFAGWVAIVSIVLLFGPRNKPETDGNNETRIGP